MFFVVLSVSGIRVLNEGWHITKRTFFKENDQEEKYEEHFQKYFFFKKDLSNLEMIIAVSERSINYLMHYLY